MAHGTHSVSRFSPGSLGWVKGWAGRADGREVKRIVTATLVTGCVLTAALQTLLAVPARADIVAVALPTTLTISSRMLTLTGTLRLSSAGTGLRSAALWFSYPGDPAATRVGSASSRRPGFLAISARIDASRIVPGNNRLEVVDVASGQRRAITLDLRRQSRIAITHAEFRPHGQVALAVRVTHFDPKLNAFAASRLSPVRLQENLNGVWVTLAEVRSDALGLAGAVLPAGPGQHSYRAIRPEGATVRTATSATFQTGPSAS